MKEKKKKINSLKLSWKAFREVISINPIMGILYFIFRNALALLSIYEIYVTGELLDSVAHYITGAKVFIWNDFLRSDVFFIFMILMGIFFVTTLLNKLNNYFDAILSDKLWYIFQKKSMDKISKLNLEDMEKSEVQDLLANVPTYSVSAVWDSYRKITEMGSNLISLISSAVVIATKMAWWGVGIILLVVPEAFFRFYYSNKIKKYRDDNTGKRKYADYLYTQSKHLPNFPELRVNNIFDFFHRSYSKVTKDYYVGEYDLILKREAHAFLWGWFDGTLERVLQILLIPFAIIKRYSIGTFKYLIDYIDNLFYSSWYVIWEFLTLQNNALYINDYFDLLEYKGFGDIASGEKKLDPLKAPRIEFKEVSFNYPSSQATALSNISYDIQPGQKIIIIGKDNSGKSTIAKLLCGLYHINPGDILLGGVSIKELHRGELKDKMAVVFENYVKYNFSIRKNITVTEPERMFNRRRYEEALEATGLDKWMKENKLSDTQILGKSLGNGMDICTGYWQRIAIARALYRDRQVLILDESLTQIDGFSRKPILQAIIKGRPKQTFIYISQDDTEKELFDKALYIDKGKIIKEEDIRK